MARLNILISGAGIAGTSLAFWLGRLGHNVTIIERASTLRTSGLQLDLRGHGIEVLKRMGLEPEFRAKSVPEQGLQLVNASGKRQAYFPANRSGKGPQSFTTDYEIMRRDFCRMLYDHTKDNATYVFGSTIEKLEQIGDSVQVRFDNGDSGNFDLVVGADGSMSRTRRLLFGNDSKNGFMPLAGLFSGYFTIPRKMKKGEDYMATMFLAPRSPMVMTRRSNPDELQIYLGGRADIGALEKVSRNDAEAEKKFVADFVEGAGWEIPEYVEGMMKSDNFYCERAGIVKIDSWSRGRVVLVGDAAYCPSGTTGMGTTAAVVGAYILAGELSEKLGHGGPAETKSITSAFESYQAKFSNFMDQVQKGLTEGVDPYSSMPTSSLGIWFINKIAGLASFFRLDVLASRFLREKILDWDLPTYKQLEPEEGLQPTS